MLIAALTLSMLASRYETIVVPTTFLGIQGKVVLGNLQSLKFDDGDVLRYQLFFVNIRPNLKLRVLAPPPYRPLGSVKYRVKCRPHTMRLTDIYFQDAAGMREFPLDRYPAWTTFEFTPSGDPNQYIDQDGNLNMWVGFHHAGPYLKSFYDIDVEYTNWVVTPG